MLDEVITVLIHLLILTSLTQCDSSRRLTAFVFMAITLSHECFAANFGGTMYFVSAAFLDLAIIVIVSYINPVNKLVVTAQKICVLSIVANFFGWCIWWWGLETTVYELIFVIIYSYTLIVFTKWNRSKDVGNNSNSVGNPRVFGNLNACFVGSGEYGGKI